MRCGLQVLVRGGCTSAMVKAQRRIIFFSLVHSEQQWTSMRTCRHRGQGPREPSSREQPVQTLAHAALGCASPTSCPGEVGRDETRHWPGVERGLQPLCVQPSLGSHKGRGINGIEGSHCLPSGRAEEAGVAL